MSTIDGQGATATWFSSFQQLPAAKEIPTRLFSDVFLVSERREEEKRRERREVVPKNDASTHFDQFHHHSR